MSREHWSRLSETFDRLLALPLEERAGDGAQLVVDLREGSVGVLSGGH